MVCKELDYDGVPLGRIIQFCEPYWWRIQWLTTILQVPAPMFRSRSRFPWIPVALWPRETNLYMLFHKFMHLFTNLILYTVVHLNCDQLATWYPWSWYCSRATRRTTGKLLVSSRDVSRRRLSAPQVVRLDQTRRHQWSPRTMYACDSCSPFATVGPSI